MIRIGYHTATYCAHRAISLPPAEFECVWNVFVGLAILGECLEGLAALDLDLAAVKRLAGPIRGVCAETCQVCGETFPAGYYEACHVPCPEIG